MVTPAKGDYGGVPITKEALQIVNTWDPAADEKAGEAVQVVWRRRDHAAARLGSTSPGRTTTRCGSMSTRARRRDCSNSGQSAAAAGTPTWQGDSAAQWERGGGRGGPPAYGGSLTVVTTNMRAGYLRKNGVPYSENASVTEYFDLVAAARWPDAGRHHRGRRSALSTAAIHRQLAFQEGSGRFQMGSHAMFGQMVTLRRSALVVLALLASASSAFAQFELAGSWAARNTEDISRDSYPVDYVGLPLNDEGRTRALDATTSRSWR